MLKSLMTLAAAGIVMAGAAFAQDEEAPAPEPVAQVGECALYTSAPEMPDPKKATADDRSAVIAGIKAFQAALKEYRECLTAASDNTELEVDAREAALKEFNRTVKIETDMVEDWQKFDKKYQKANK